MRLWLVGCLAVRLCAQGAPALLDQVKARATENLRRLPDYTCTETIDRAVRMGRRARLRKDTVRVNVAYVEGQELFGRVGESRIDQIDLVKIAGTPVGNGQFALFVKSIFEGRRATFWPLVETKLQGKQVFRSEYAVPLAVSGFRIQSGAGSAVVAYGGSFWVARDTLDLMRLILSAKQLPARLNIVSDVTAIDYGPVSIGGRIFSLPLRSTWETKDIFGAQTRNITTFEHCHEFVGESTLKFGDP